MHRIVAAAAVSAWLAACASEPEAPVSDNSQECRVLESRIGTHRLGKRCQAVSDAERAKAREEAEAAREVFNREQQARPAGNMR